MYINPCSSTEINLILISLKQVFLVIFLQLISLIKNEMTYKSCVCVCKTVCVRAHARHIRHISAQCGQNALRHSVMFNVLKCKVHSENCKQSFSG